MKTKTIYLLLMAALSASPAFAGDNEKGKTDDKDKITPYAYDLGMFGPFNPYGFGDMGLPDGKIPVDRRKTTLELKKEQRNIDREIVKLALEAETLKKRCDVKVGPVQPDCKDFQKKLTGLEAVIESYEEDLSDINRVLDVLADGMVKETPVTCLTCDYPYNYLSMGGLPIRKPSGILGGSQAQDKKPTEVKLGQ